MLSILKKGKHKIFDILFVLMLPVGFVFTLYAFKIKEKTEGFPLNFTFLYDKLTKIRLNFNLLQNCNQF